MQIQFYPYDFDYKVKDGKVYFYLYSKLENGDKVCVVHQYQPYFFAQVNDVDTEIVAGRLKKLKLGAKEELAEVVFWETVEKELLGKKERFWKIYANYPKAVPLLSKEIESWGIKCYEKDILFVHRYLRDNNITPLTLVQAEGSFSENAELRVPVFQAENVRDAGKESLQKYKILAIDIETYAQSKEINPGKNPVLMVAFYGVDESGSTFKKVITWRQFSHQLDYLEMVSDEVELLRRCRKIIVDYLPDIITGYYSDGFDFPYLKTRAEKQGLKLDIGVDRSELLVSSRGGNTEARIRGMLHLDMLKFVRNIIGLSLKTDSYSLDAVSAELLGSKKHVVNLNDLAHIWDIQPEKLPDFCAYNLHDAHLAFQLCKKLLPDVVEFTKLIGLPASDLIRMRFSRLVESYILKRAMEFNVLAPNRPGSVEIEQRTEETYQGGYVYEPQPGLYKDLVVFDFRSLYPTIIMAHGIGPEGLHCPCCLQNKVPGNEEYWFCSKEKKFIPSVLEQLILRRADLKRLIKEAKKKNEDTKLLDTRSFALKTLANSFYGYLGFYGARWYCLECARSTTAYARNYIKSTIRKAEEKGFQVIYADTDSCFLLLGDKYLEQAKEFMNEINFDLPGHMELEFEGYYPRGIFVALKGKEAGAKKKYALRDEKGNVKITGFETVRRNWSVLAKDVQERVLTLVLDGRKEEALDYVKNVIKELKEGKLPLEKLILKTQITRELSSYSSVGPHVYVAKELEKKGEKIFPGMVIEYVIADGTGLVRERAMLPEEVRKYDAGYYLYSQLLPAVIGIFDVVGITEDDILGRGKQTGLGKFF